MSQSGSLSRPCNYRLWIIAVALLLSGCANSAGAKTRQAVRDAIEQEQQAYASLRGCTREQLTELAGLEVSENDGSISPADVTLLFDEAERYCLQGN